MLHTSSCLGLGSTGPRTRGEGTLPSRRMNGENTYTKAWLIWKQCQRAPGCPCCRRSILLPLPQISHATQCCDFQSAHCFPAQSSLVFFVLLNQHCFSKQPATASTASCTPTTLGMAPSMWRAVSCPLGMLFTIYAVTSRAQP